MTKEAYKEHLRIIDNQINQLYDEKAALRDKFLKENAEFSVGDKVAVIWDSSDKYGIKRSGRRIECYISGINDKYYFGKVDYNFKKIKKDGTPSSQSAGIYGGWDRIEKL